MMGELLALTKSEYLLAVNSPIRHIRSSGWRRSENYQQQNGPSRELRSTQSRLMQAPELLRFQMSISSQKIARPSITLYQVAELAGVSHQTVSRVVNGSSLVTDRT